MRGRTPYMLLSYDEQERRASQNTDIINDDFEITLYLKFHENQTKILKFIELQERGDGTLLNCPISVQIKSHKMLT